MLPTPFATFAHPWRKTRQLAHNSHQRHLVEVALATGQGCLEVAVHEISKRQWGGDLIGEHPHVPDVFKP